MINGRAELLLEKECPVSDAIVAALADLGIEYVFGMPGGGVGQVFSALYEHPTIRPILVREESIGSYMAEAYGRLRGWPVVVMGQGEWIVGNAGQGLLESLLGSSPIVVLTDLTDGGTFSHHGFYQSGSGDYGAWDARNALGAVTKRVMVSHYPAQAVQHVQLAVKHAVTGDPGPVAVAFTTMALRGTVKPIDAPRLYRSWGYLPTQPNAPDAIQLDRICKLLQNATSPVFLAGNGVRVGRSCDALRRAAEVLDIPVVTTSHGKGVMAEDHDLAAGVIGAFGWPSANDLVAESDVIVAIGTKLATVDTINESTSLIDPTKQVLIHVDSEPLNAGWTTPVAEVVVADASLFLESLISLGDSTLNSVRPAASLRVRQVVSRRAPRKVPRDEASPPFEPEELIEVLNEVIGPDFIVTCDAGENRLFMTRWYRSRRAGGLLQPASGGGMGHAVPAAMGAKLADRGANVLAVCGDGGFAMSLHALMTSVEQQLPVGVLILNNGALGWVLHGMGEKATASTLAAFDYAEIARAIGCQAFTPQTFDELREALRSIPGASRPTVIDVPTSLATSFRDILDPLDDRRSESGY